MVGEGDLFTHTLLSLCGEANKGTVLYSKCAVGISSVQFSHVLVCSVISCQIKGIPHNASYRLYPGGVACCYVVVTYVA